MITDKNFKISLDFILPKIKIGAFDYYGTEFDHLAHVYLGIKELSTGKGGVLSKGCSGVRVQRNQVVLWLFLLRCLFERELLGLFRCRWHTNF